MMKKLIAILMVAVTCLVMFTACKDGKKADAAKDAGQSQGEGAMVISEELKNAEATPLVDDALVTVEEELSGEWKSTEKDYMMWIYFKEGVCHVDIDGVTEEGMGTWNLSGDVAEVDGYKRIVAIDCAKVLNTADQGILPIYEDGKAYVFEKDGQIVWIDESEQAGKGLIFEKSE